MKIKRLAFPRQSFNLICFLALTVGKLKVGQARRTCYNCIWIIHKTENPRERIQNNQCLPDTFNPRNVSKVTCTFDCMTMVRYGYVGINRTNFFEYSDITRTKAFMNRTDLPIFATTDPNRTAIMTVFYRGCSPHNMETGSPKCKQSTDVSEKEMHVFQEKCYCSTHLCNGGVDNRTQLSSGNIMGFNILNLFLVLMYHLVFTIC